ncbi:MAG TPA: metallophosphoesterase [Phycisphaerae bacterium]|nr:metallophosphoesterase [Phycisphaerae bacterium]HPS53464.1 metallophosphoesterase [Phycisphaerae bacterium]
MNNPAAEIFLNAAELCMNCPQRHGNVVNLSGVGRVMVSGDIHGARVSLNKIVSRFNSSEQPILILQEIIHGPADAAGFDRSAELLLKAARLKCQHPDRIYFVMGNHDLAQFAGGEITKDGSGVCAAFREGVKNEFGDEAYEVYSAAMKFLRALPLAVRFDNGTLVSHSLPSPSRMKFFDPAVLDNPTLDADIKRGGAVYEMLWGRDQRPEQLDELAKMLGVDFFLLGHRHITAGLLPIPRRAAAINSNALGGCIVEFDAGIDTISLADIEKYVKRIAQL